MLIHGTGDDNVHWQNTAELVKMMIKNGLQFDTMFYPNRDHSIDAEGSSTHLYTLITNYLSDRLVK